jgi:S-ribosylhomocysteine lyase LuxS involved in autoinducer biosynthesis
MDEVIDSEVCKSFIEEMNSVPTAATGNCGAAYIHALIMASNVMAE